MVMVVSVIALSGLVAIGCARNGGDGENRFRIPWMNEKGDYSLQDVSITGFDELHSLQGRFVRIFVNPFTRNGRLESETPVGQFIRSENGINIPADYTSLQAAAIHAHFERLYEIDHRLGADLDWPVKIGIRSRVKDRRGAINNNAIFDGRLDALLIVPYSGAGLPIAVNAGILAHEHFHMIFQKAVLNRIRFKRKERLGIDHGYARASADARTADASDERPDLYASLFNEFTLRALNEGLADFWGWVYTGDVDFISPSIPEEGKMRRMDLEVRQMLSRENSKKLVFGPNSGRPYSDRILGGNAYRLGTTYARLMRKLAAASSNDEGRSLSERMKAARAVIKALPTIASALSEAEAKGEFVSANAFLKPLHDNWPQNPKDEGTVCRIFARMAAPDPDSFAAKLNCPGSTPQPDVEAPVPSGARS